MDVIDYYKQYHKDQRKEFSSLKKEENKELKRKRGSEEVINEYRRNLRQQPQKLTEFKPEKERLKQMARRHPKLRKAIAKRKGSTERLKEIKSVMKETKKMKTKLKETLGRLEKENQNSSD